MRQSVELRAVLLCLLVGSPVWADTATIRVDAAESGPTVNPRMYGIFLEEINHGVDGGLYAELVRNRGFEDGRAPEGYELRDGRWVDAAGFNAGYDEFGYKLGGLPFWSLVKSDGAVASMYLETSGGVTDESSYCLRLDIEIIGDGRVGVANIGYFGIGVDDGARYALSLYTRGGAGFAGPLTVRLEDASGEAVSDEATIEKVGNDWTQNKATLTATRDEPNARLVILAGDVGQVWFDFVSLFPEQTWKGRPNGLRSDIAQMIADLKPGFVRFPGGCVVEAGTVESAYNWKWTVGPLTERTERWGPWHYRRTQGIGLHEYLQFCEDLDAEPLYVGFAGQTCIYREREHVPMSDMDWVRDNFLDVVEYANGPADSRWGKMRADAGHPDSFDLQYVEIGNENAAPEYEERYRFIYDAMHAKYPDLTYLADVSYYRMPRDIYDIADRHYYNSPTWFLSRFHEYDGYDRNLPPIYLGEVAVTSQHGGPTRGNLLAALAEGVYLLGCEQNADVVTMVSYAPLLAHVDGRTWNWHGMIYHDNTRAYGTVSYYLWKMFGENRPDQIVSSSVELQSNRPDTIAGRIGIGTWNATAEFKDIRVERNGAEPFAADFADDDTSDWETAGGRWQAEDGVYRQRRRGNGLSYIGDEDWTDYTLTLKARQMRGREGFLIVFGKQGSDQYWWNLGGWGNTQHAIEMNQNPVGRPRRGTIEAERWYDVKIELAGRRIRCYLDGELVHDVTAEQPEEFFVTSGVDNATGELVVKAINMTDAPISGRLQLDGLAEITATGKLIVLTADDLSANNTMDKPQAVVPTEHAIDGLASEFTHKFPARSLSVLRIPIGRTTQ
jgi:alpha-L-arabinofuranosidase